MAAQSIQGDQGVLIEGASGSTFNITYGRVTRAVPIERATVPISPDARSPASLIRARSGVVPFTARKGLRDELIEWLKGDAPFAGAVIGGAAGAGKTRLAVELCDWAEDAEWLGGILTEIEDLASLEALAEASIPRLIAVDYAESRAAQMKLLLPLLASRATSEAPVRVLLLVRANPKRTTDWAEGLRNQSDLLDNLLDECGVHVLEDLPLEAGERAELFETAAAAFAGRSGTTAPSAPTALLESPVFKSPLLVVLAAYLAVHGDEAPPSTREELLRAVLLHEERYWRSSSGDLLADEAQRRRVIALVTLFGAENESEAVEWLRLLPDFDDAPAERLGLVARWAAERYPGAGWWGPLEPDLIGEQLIADELSDQPAVLSGALASEKPRQLVRPLEVLGRAAANHPQFAATLHPILGSELSRLCQLAVDQARDGANRELIYGRAVALASVLEKAVNAIKVDDEHLSSALGVMPRRSNLVLNSLALALSLQFVERHRRLIEDDPINHEPSLARAADSLSARLREVGRHAEALKASEESVEIHRRLAADDALAHEVALAKALNNLCVHLCEVGRHAEALKASEESVEIHRRLAAADPTAHEPDLAVALNNLCVHLGNANRHADALRAIGESVEIDRRLAAADPTAHEPDLAVALNNLSAHLAEEGRNADGLKASEESAEVFRRLAADDPATYEPNLATVLFNRSIQLRDMDRDAEALKASEESVEIYRRLAADEVFELDLAIALNNLSIHLAEAGRSEEGLAMIEHSAEVLRRFAAADPAAHEPDLAMALNNLSDRLGEVDRAKDALEASEESVKIYRRLTADDSPAHEPDLAKALNGLSVHLSNTGRRAECLLASEECARIRRRLAAESPAAHESDPAMALSKIAQPPRRDGSG